MCGWGSPPSVLMLGVGGSRPTYCEAAHAMLVPDVAVQNPTQQGTISAQCVPEMCILARNLGRKTTECGTLRSRRTVRGFARLPGRAIR
eukprot:2571179-Rhodomonas_salina.3